MYQDDTPADIYRQLEELENEIEKVGRNIKVLARNEAEAIADYELAKNMTIIDLIKEEASPEFTGKRTDKQREALYRSRHHGLRLAKGLAMADVKSERDLLSALDAKMSGLQSRKGIIMMERDRSFTGRT